jgi:hypothetical protein
MGGNLSEVAQIRQQIEQVCQSMNQALTGYSIVAKHSIISCKYQALDVCHERLKSLVGENEAVEIICTTYNKEVH